MNVRRSTYAGAEFRRRSCEFLRREHRQRNCFKEISESNRLLAVRAFRAGSDTKTKDAAFLASLVAEVACRTLRALVHRRQPRRSSRQRWQRSRVTLAPGSLSAGRITETLPP